MMWPWVELKMLAFLSEEQQQQMPAAGWLAGFCLGRGAAGLNKSAGTNKLSYK